MSDQSKIRRGEPKPVGPDFRSPDRIQKENDLYQSKPTDEQIEYCDADSTKPMLQPKPAGEQDYVLSDEIVNRMNPKQPTGEWTVEQRITDYLSSGGLFNPELADHDAVSRLLFDCRAALAAERENVDELARFYKSDIKHYRELAGCSGNDTLATKIQQLREQLAVAVEALGELWNRIEHSLTGNLDNDVEFELGEYITTIDAALAKIPK